MRVSSAVNVRTSPVGDLPLSMALEAIDNLRRSDWRTTLEVCITSEVVPRFVCMFSRCPFGGGVGEVLKCGEWPTVFAAVSISLCGACWDRAVSVMVQCEKVRSNSIMPRISSSREQRGRKSDPCAAVART